MENENQPEEIHPEEEVASVAELSATAQVPVQTPVLDVGAQFIRVPGQESYVAPVVATAVQTIVLVPVLTESINPRIPTDNDSQIY